MNSKINDRMKEYYEEPARTKLTRRTPVIVRVDGRAFHTFTKNLKKPFDMHLTRAMQATAKYLLQNVQGAKMVYTQSDEISLLLIDYDGLDQSAFFDYEVQKIVSTIASMATCYFNRTFGLSATNTMMDMSAAPSKDAEHRKYFNALSQCADEGATFDARCFNIPEHEVVNYFVSRQKDAYRNSISSIGRSMFSQKMLHKKHTEDILKMIAEYKGINDITTEYAEATVYGYELHRTKDGNGKTVYNSYCANNFNDVRVQIESELIPDV